MVLLNDRGDQARYAHAITAHNRDIIVAVLVQYWRLHGRAIGTVELKDMTNLNAAQKTNLADAIWGSIALHNVAHIDNLSLG